MDLYKLQVMEIFTDSKKLLSHEVSDFIDNRHRKLTISSLSRNMLKLPSFFRSANFIVFTKLKTAWRFHSQSL